MSRPMRDHCIRSPNAKRPQSSISLFSSCGETVVYVQRVTPQDLSPQTIRTGDGHANVSPLSGLKS